MDAIDKLFIVCFFLSVYLVIRYQFLNHLSVIQLQRRQRRRQFIYKRFRRREIVRSGIASLRLLQMDDNTFRRHLRLNRWQYHRFQQFVVDAGLEATDIRRGGGPRVSAEKKSLIFLWYMATNETFREISDKFDVAESTAHGIISDVLKHISVLSNRYIKWPNDHEKAVNAYQFNSLWYHNIIGAIDGCHIRIQKLRIRGEDYLNRKGYYSILLQGICDFSGKFIDIYVGPPGRVHDARMLKSSPFFDSWRDKMGNMRLLGDSAYLCNDFPFILTPKRDNGRLTNDDKEKNTCISRRRVVIENTFGRFRRLRDMQNYNLEIVVQLIVAACMLHNVLTDSPLCHEHPDGCPRDNDDNM